MNPDNSQPETDNNQPVFHLGKEALDGFQADPVQPQVPNAPQPEVPITPVASVEQPKRDTAKTGDELIRRPLIESYPKVADNDKEVLLADVRRFWLGRFSILFTGGFIILILLIAIFALPSLFHGIGLKGNNQAKGLLSLVLLFVIVLVALGTYVTYWVYSKSRMLITDANVIELKQKSLFAHEVSHLNMINVEDVNVSKRGILQTMLDFGTLTIETAGEEENFVFINTPTPDKYRKIVVNAHEEAIERIGQMGPAQRYEITKGEL
jgi:cell division protein FtsL